MTGHLMSAYRPGRPLVFVVNRQLGANLAPLWDRLTRLSICQPDMSEEEKEVA